MVKNGLMPVKEILIHPNVLSNVINEYEIRNKKSGISSGDAFESKTINTFMEKTSNFTLSEHKQLI